LRNVTNSPVAENIVGKWVAGSSLAIHQTELIKDTFPSRASSELLSAGIGELGAGSIECLASHDLRAWSSEDGYLCSMFHGPLQLQIRIAFLLPARLFPTVARQSATQLSHTTFSQLSEPTQRPSSPCTLLFPFPACFSALHCRSSSLAFVLTSTNGPLSL
jgi:hypothetical protein